MHMHLNPSTTNHTGKYQKMRFKFKVCNDKYRNFHLSSKTVEYKIKVILYPDLNGFEGWMDKKFDYQRIRKQLFS